MWNKGKKNQEANKWLGHGFSRQITKKCGTKYENGNYIFGHPKWKWKLYFGTEGVIFSFNDFNR